MPRRGPIFWWSAAAVSAASGGAYYLAGQSAVLRLVGTASVRIAPIGAPEGELAEAKMLLFARAWEIFRRPRRTPNPRPYHPIDPPR